jgi:hypothetical protein
MPIPAEIAEIWTHINDETVMVHAYWITFMDLFGGPNEQLEILDQSAGFFFNVIQDALATDIQLTLSKVSDPAMTFKKENATVRHLLDELEKLNAPELMAKLKDLYDAFNNACEPVRELRNKVIAHSDRNIALRKTTAPAAATVGQIRAALKALADLMNAIESYFDGSETAYDLFSSRGAGVEALIGLLKRGLRYDVLQKEGVILWEDVP